MTYIKVTQADRDLAGWFLRRMTGGETWRGYVEGLLSRHRIEAQRPLLEALERLMDSIMERTKGDYAGFWDNALAAIKQAKGE